MVDSEEAINLVTGYAKLTGGECIGTYTYTACTLQAAVRLPCDQCRVKYPSQLPPRAAALTCGNPGRRIRCNRKLS